MQGGREAACKIRGAHDRLGWRIGEKTPAPSVLPTEVDCEGHTKVR